MELLRLERGYCSGAYRNDLSASLGNIVAVVVTNFPKDTVTLGRIFPKDRSFIGDSNNIWWLLGYNLRFHMVFAIPVTEGKGSSYIMSTRSHLRTVDGAKSVFNAYEWRVEVITDKLFKDLNINSVNDEAVVASFLDYPPDRLSVALGYSLFRLEKHKSEVELPFVTEWVELEIPYGVKKVTIPEGVKHLAITSTQEDTFVHVPDTIVSCHVRRKAPLRLSIPRKFAKYWGYWSAVWGNTYKITEGFKSTPDGMVIVRD